MPFIAKAYSLARILGILLLCVISCKAQESIDARVDRYIKSEMQRHHIPGLSLAVMKDGKIIKAEGYGLANVELKVPARPDTVYKIGSVSKQLIAAGVLLLVEQGKVNLDDQISKYLEGTPETWKEITVRHLLTHTSGIVREAPGFDPLKIQKDADVIKTAYPLPLRFTPGEKYEYCNTGYFTLAEIIRKVTGKPWSDYLSESVFHPLGMNATRPTNISEITPNRASGYSWQKGELQNAPNLIALRPSGAFLSTVLDLAKWDAALYTDKVLKQSTRESMWAPVKLNNGELYPYGFGWRLDPIGGRRQVGHGGSLPGFRAGMMRFVDEKLTVVILTNSDNANPESIAMYVADFYIPGLIPERVVARIDPKVFDAYLGQYQVSPTVVMTMMREGDKLMMQRGAAPEKQELAPESESRFFIKEDRRPTYSFIKDERGQVAYLVIHVDRREVGRAKKIR